MKYELNEIGSVVVDGCDFDEESYREYLEENNLQDSPENKINYVKEYCTFDIEYTDSDTYHHMGYDSFMYDDLELEFGERMANDMLMSWIEGVRNEFEPLYYMDDTVDTNNIESIEQDALKKLKHGEYFKGARGFILTNGIMVYTPAEHSMISRVEGVGDKFDAIKMGWIRVLPQSIDVGQKPTDKQRLVIGQIVDCYLDETLYVDVFKDGEHGMVYNEPNTRRVLNDINRFFGGSLIESKTRPNKLKDIKKKFYKILEKIS